MPNSLLELWRRWRAKPVPFAKALAVGALSAALAFLLGANFSSPESRKLNEEIGRLDEEMRALAEADLRRARESEGLRAQLSLRAAENKRLAEENRDLISDVFRREQRILLYEQIVDARSSEREITIHALDESPDFYPGKRRLAAVLIPSGRGKFKGKYVFEVVSVLDGEQTVARVPATPAALDFKEYREIAETVELPERAQIVKVRLIVTDAKNKIAASREAFLAGGDENNETVTAPAPAPTTVTTVAPAVEI